jgi:outer membrane lipoprotein-sorting protein
MEPIMRHVFRVAVLFLLLASVLPVAAKDEWTAKSVMKQVDKATKNAKWITGVVQWNEFLASAINVDGAGEVWVDLGGRLRAEVKGSNPRTVLISPGYVQLYKPLEEVTEVYGSFAQPDLLVQYVMLGFHPRGSDLKRDYKVALVKREQIDDRETFLLELTPKDKIVAEAFPALMLWIDGTTWLPAQQLIRQGSGGLQVSITYRDLTHEPELPATLFRSEWPEGTKVVHK